MSRYTAYKSKLKIPKQMINFFYKVSWVRHRDIHLLTVGRYTYTSDQRFEAQHKPRSEEWALRIRSPQRRDSGQYECQISTTPPIGHAVFLNIVGKRLSILNYSCKSILLVFSQVSFYFTKGLCSSEQIYHPLDYTTLYLVFPFLFYVLL